MVPVVLFNRGGESVQLVRSRCSISCGIFIYDIRHILILGRVTSGKGGSVIVEYAEKVLKTEFPDLAEKIMLHLPDESNRRVGQSIAAASLPEIKVVVGKSLDE